MIVVRDAVVTKLDFYFQSDIRSENYRHGKNNSNDNYDKLYNFLAQIYLCPVL